MRNQGFTLVEILIVVIILGILAAIVIPQFTEASNDARESALQSDLQTGRSQLELYRVQHLERYPNQIAAVGTDATKWMQQLTARTDENGVVGNDPAVHRLGPYLQSFPTNSFVGGAGNVPDGVTVTNAAVAGDGKTGWWFDTTTGRFSANSDKVTFPDHVTW